ncbi:MAG: hypothetical protein JNL69_02325 [Bacteroidia bacterium]|nr:hypothetical protein [Bacteroidia bacterium]
MANQNPTELEFATVFKDKNGIIIITMKDYKKLDQYDVLNINIAIRHKAEGKPALKLLDARAKWSMDKKAKERAKLEQAASVTKARAIVVSNVITASLMKFLQSFAKHEYPQKNFTDYDEAYNWLLSIKEDKH